VTTTARPKLFILVGPPGSGKTYFSRKFAENNNFVRINSDDVREAMYTQPTYSPEERADVYREMNKGAIDNLKAGKQVIFDGNLLTNAERFQALQQFQQYGDTLFVTLQTTKDEALRRAMERSNMGDPDYAANIQNMHQAFEPLDPKLPSITITSASYPEMERLMFR
jgi:predicted kinase